MLLLDTTPACMRPTFDHGHMSNGWLLHTSSCQPHRAGWKVSPVHIARIAAVNSAKARWASARPQPHRACMARVACVTRALDTCVVIKVISGICFARNALAVGTAADSGSPPPPCEQGPACTQAAKDLGTRCPVWIAPSWPERLSKAPSTLFARRRRLRPRSKNA